jgi:hypothetical protein
MKALAYGAAVIASALAASGCAGSVAAHQQSWTDATQIHESTVGQLSQPLRKFMRSTIIESGEGSATEIDVYGPASRTVLVKDLTGDMAVESPRQLTQPFYLIVLHGHFVCGTCPVPYGAKAPAGTIETRIWSHGTAAVEYGVTSNLPMAVSLLNHPATIQLS